VDDDYVDISISKAQSEQTCKSYTLCLRIHSSQYNYRQVTPNYLDFVSSYIESIGDILRPLSLKIHDNPELNFEEFIAHKALTEFLKTRKGWKVTPSAYGLATAFVAEYDSGKPGPVVSYNAEYGKIKLFLEYASTDIINRCSSRYWPCLRS
jgi:hypothetical protein